MAVQGSKKGKVLKPKLIEGKEHKAGRRATIPKKSKGAPPKGNKYSERRLRAAGDIVGELRSLRAEVKTILERYLLQVSAQINALIGVFDGAKDKAEECLLPSLEEAKAILTLIRGLKTKPKKGRGKDLARIQALLNLLQEKLPPQP